MTALNESTVCMGEPLVQIGLERKAILAADWDAALRFDAPMASEGSFSKFQQEFMARTKEARKAVRPKISQVRMGKLLGDLPQGTYKHYEVDRLLPHEYVELFCVLTQRSPNWLFTGEEMAEAAPPPLPVRQVYPPQRKRK